MLVLNRSEVEELLDLDELVGALARAHEELSAGATSMPARIAAFAEAGLLGAMPAYLPSAGLGCKLVTLFPHNIDRPTHQAAIVLFDPASGSPIALMDGTYVTAIRTAAAAALATRLLARDDANVLALIGTGVQARSHARAIIRVRPIRQLRIAGRSPERSRALARELSASLGVEAVACDTYADAIAGAGIVCATTHSVEPVVRREWLEPGTHVTSVGYNPDGRELDDATVAESLVVVESRAAALAPFPSGSSDLLGPIAAGLITADHVHAEIGELVSGARPGRTSAGQLTLYKSVGVAVQDAAAAALVLAAARRRGMGAEIAL